MPRWRNPNFEESQWNTLLEESPCFNCGESLVECFCLPSDLDAAIATRRQAIEDDIADRKRDERRDDMLTGFLPFEEEDDDDEIPF
jgi:hypothetical protein